MLGMEPKGGLEVDPSPPESRAWLETIGLSEKKGWPEKLSGKVRLGLGILHCRRRSSVRRRGQGGSLPRMVVPSDFGCRRGKFAGKVGYTVLHY